MWNDETRPYYLIAFVALTLGWTIGLVAGISSAPVTLPLMSGLLSILSGIFLVKLADLESKPLAKLSLAIACFCVSLLLGLACGVTFRLNFAIENPGIGELLKGTDSSTDSQADILCRTGNIAGLEALCSTEK